MTQLRKRCENSPSEKTQECRGCVISRNAKVLGLFIVYFTQYVVRKRSHVPTERKTEDLQQETESPLREGAIFSPVSIKTLGDMLL